jgi:hypothetical protein
MKCQKHISDTILKFPALMEPEMSLLYPHMHTIGSSLSHLYLVIPVRQNRSKDFRVFTQVSPGEYLENVMTVSFQIITYSPFVIIL